MQNDLLTTSEVFKKIKIKAAKPTKS